jgi:hypothetical protein
MKPTTIIIALLAVIAVMMAAPTIHGEVKKQMAAIEQVKQKAESDAWWADECRKIARGEESPDYRKWPGQYALWCRDKGYPLPNVSYPN